MLEGTMDVSGTVVASSPRTLVIEEGRDYVVERRDVIPLDAIKRLGDGHSGYVEQVKDTSTGTIYARKTIRIYHSGQDHRAKQLKVFKNEVNILRILAQNHHFVRVVTTFVEKRQLSLVIEPVADEGDLNAFLNAIRDEQEDNDTRDVEPVKFKILQKAFGCLASGLAFMHCFRVRHKDIKPQNILVHRGQVLYTDFGYSHDSNDIGRSTTAGRPDFWTERFSAPEVLAHDDRNSKSDVFSLGCVYIEILSVLDPKFEITREFCFGRDLVRLRALLEAGRAQGIDALQEDTDVLLSACISMTDEDPKGRLNASKVAESLKSCNNLFCDQCFLPPTVQALGKVEAEPKTLSGNLEPSLSESSDTTKSTKTSLTPIPPSEDEVAQHGMMKVRSEQRKEQSPTDVSPPALASKSLAIRPSPSVTHQKEEPELAALSKTPSEPDTYAGSEDEPETDPEEGSEEKSAAKRRESRQEGRNSTANPRHPPLNNPKSNSSYPAQYRRISPIQSLYEPYYQQNFNPYQSSSYSHILQPPSNPYLSYPLPQISPQPSPLGHPSSAYSGRPIHPGFKTNSSSQNTQSSTSPAVSGYDTDKSFEGPQDSRDRYYYRAPTDSYPKPHRAPAASVPYNYEKPFPVSDSLSSDDKHRMEAAWNQAQMPELLNPTVREKLPDLIEGTPDRGWYETLDTSYRMRTGPEARQFFRIGRVFSMLYGEATSETEARSGSDNDAVTLARFGQRLYSQIRRFVVVSVRHGYVNTCAMSTYSQRGVLKPGCNPSEHTVIYSQGKQPTYIEGEFQAGMIKEPIEFIPADSSVVFNPFTRLRLGKTYPIEWNVKVKDIGAVHPEHLSKLLMYWRIETVDDSEED
ncbi:unnamed protein product [Periconia digitata]|uniref:non-specific serine/threonine protein kinase n=1 Tax=Periconia digitata TaxID=1303443 RepID=A0A9W4UAX0_9PLEO|nr:unnamed protein product [Periconia digitata]